MAGGSSGGGVSGAVSLPSYLTYVHSDWLSGDSTITPNGDVVETNMTEAMNDALGASPYSGMSAFNPATLEGEMDTGVDNFGTVVSGLSHTTDFATILSSAVGATFLANNLATLIGKIDILETIATGITPITEYTNAHSAAISRATLIPTHISTAAGDVTDLETFADAITPATDWGSSYEAVKLKVDALIGEAGGNLDTLITKLGELYALAIALDPEQTFEDLVETVVQSIDDFVTPATYIADKADAFNTLVNTEVEDVILPRFQAGMRDIGAVMNSSFTLGQAKIEAEAENRKTQFLADLNFQVHQARTQLIASLVGELVRLFLAKFGEYRGFAGLYSNAYIEDDRIKSALYQLYITGVDGVVKMYDVKADSKKAVAGASVELYKAADALYFDAVKAGVEAVERALALKIEAQKAATTLYTGTYSKYDGMANDNVMNAVGQMARMHLYSVEMKRALAALIVEQKRIAIVAYKEQADRDAEIDVEDALWDLKVFHHGATLMAASAGGSPGQVANIPKPSVLGGMLSGAAAGAMIGAEIGGGNAGIGAIIGGLAGGAGALLG